MVPSYNVQEYLAIAIAAGLGAYLIAQTVAMGFNEFASRVVSIIPTF